MGWIYLLFAGVFEVLFTTAIRYTEGFTKLMPTLLVLTLAGISFLFVAKATATIPLGTAYAVWGGIGAAGTALIGIFVFGEPAEAKRIAFLALLITSIAGLKIVSDQ